MKEWKLLDDQVNQLLKSVDDEGLDEAFDKMNLERDEFDEWFSGFMTKLQQTEESIEI